MAGSRCWSKYYGIETPVTITISLSLIFVILVYVCPLKLIFTALFAWLMPVKIAIYAGFIYITLPVSMPAIAIYFGRQIELEKKTS
ncbi:MAG: hypothetical protein K9G67_12945 [Bacteroidales bacterium]|nr:hypothetical protein [Bacteroidales bacterium]MCF8352681.1 hypothetical protein [Bacteroidales bacterium]MCF8377258.1 hypothetical protein [Bacteroidales bacterium]MCF8401120.1 hypothetical protein [Bacteroidales bacterium]